ncbi:Na+/H+ antiporter subunit E [Aestuariirhabdus litorea]|uniref:Na+/H+ antiporter subunit E n=1 Tax=Aestuariirhabdus litorea TaxID=2528527 RepID=A0A3P3VSR0_9GAMM|nr:Na+/H+ antiporter subunit E [Aestuariirhabdus litorea]RRJ83813.1 Na+/H+ antiporter subunit E [Aestuariirhabdus litorea]RWW97036.1 Na+/H+ antiporter subunit E [Endozoicomonadaceae bacterium GTF-13]
MNENKGFKLFPHPGTSLLLLLVWLLLNNSLSAGQVVLGSLLAVAIPLLTAPLQYPQPTFHKPWIAFLYVLRVVWDIIVSNFQVARQVLGPIGRLRPAFIAIPLDIEAEVAITILANTISLTPGTVSTDLSKDHRWLYVHVLNLEDEEELIRTIKQRYETPLKEIFGC